MNTCRKQTLSQYEKMTQMPIPALIIQLGIPTVISMLVTNLYNMADTAFVGQLGNSASGAVGIVFGFMAILQAVGFMFGQGAGSILSRKLGMKDAESASRFASTGFFLAFFGGALIEMIGFIFLNPLVMLLGSTRTIAPFAEQYISFILAAAPFVVSSFVLNNILRYEGKASLGMIGLLAGAILNICGDPVFMFVFDMGIAGAGLSTAVSQVISFCILLSMFLRGKTECRLSLRRITHDFREILDIMETGLPSMLRQGLNSFATVLLNAQAAVYGDAAIAAMSIVSRIVMFVFSIVIGIGQGFQPVSGFNYGAGKYSRVRKAFRFTFLLAEGMLIVMVMAVMLCSDDLIQIFRDDAVVIKIGTRALHLQCISLLFLPFCMVTEMLLQSTGQKFSASLLSSLRSGVFFIPALLFLARYRGLSGIQEAQPAAFVFSCFAAVFFAAWFFKQVPKQDAAEQPH
ncbi:MAG: MATE family efflux transporter [Lachnospiraceae bacterium]|nr:MATE family efflux transporter [Lachnospiraceae bacterium]